MPLMSSRVYTLPWSASATSTDKLWYNRANGKCWDTIFTRTISRYPRQFTNENLISFFIDFLLSTNQLKIEIGTCYLSLFFYTFVIVSSIDRKVLQNSWSSDLIKNFVERHYFSCFKITIKFIK